MPLSDWMLILGVPAIIILAVMAAKRMKALRTRIDEFRKEQETTQTDPYADLAQLWADRNKLK